jgi:hypothetical protein
MNWAEQSPHKHRYTPLKHPKAGLAANFCRNPSNHRTIWCYTTDPKKRWEECAPRTTCPPVAITMPPIVVPKPTVDPVVPINPVKPPPSEVDECKEMEKLSGKAGKDYRGA